MMKLFRVVNTDNFNGDYPDEKFVGQPMAEDCARALTDQLNGDEGMYSSRFYKVVPEGYQLVPGFQP